jgi:hypothetical protein
MSVKAETGMRITSIVAIAIGAISLAPASASAQARADYPFCAYGGKTTEGLACDFATLAQCQAATAGSGGSCVANPRAGQGAHLKEAGSAGKR